MSKKIANMLTFMFDSIKLIFNVRALRLKFRFRYSTIEKLQDIKYSNLNNIYIGKNVHIFENCILRILNSCSLYIGEGTHIGHYCHIAGTQNRIIIGRNVLVADRVFISTTNYRFDDIKKPIKNQGFISKGNIVIGDECWIGIGSSILSGVKIGKHSIIGANSVVTHNIQSYSVAVGNPARVIKKYKFKEKKWLKIKKDA